MVENYSNGKRPWVYRGENVYPADCNSSGIRWYAYVGAGMCLRSDTKTGMRELIRERKGVTHG